MRYGGICFHAVFYLGRQLLIRDFSAYRTQSNNKLGLLVQTSQKFQLTMQSIHPAPGPKVPIPSLPLPVSSKMENIEQFDPQKLATTVQTILVKAADPSLDQKEVRSYLSVQSLILLRGMAFNILLYAIDPETGDSVLHRAAAADNFPFLRTFSDCHPRISAEWQHRDSWLLNRHQNHVGDTALHVAARTGHLGTVKAIYRLFMGNSILDIDIDGYEPGQELGSEPVCVPLDEDEWSQQDDPYWFLRALEFVSAKNNDGLDAATVARLAGFENLGLAIEGLVASLDVFGRKDDTDYIRQGRNNWLSFYGWYEDYIK